MKPLTRKAATAVMNIQQFIEHLYRIYLKYKAKNQESERLQLALKKLDNDNPEFSSIANDKRESMRMYWIVALLFLSIVVDLLATFESCRIIAELMFLPVYITYLFPVVLVLIEIGIAYFQLEAFRKGERGSWLTRNAQYLVMIIVCGLVLMTIFFSIEAYSKESDQVSFTTFLVGTLLYEIALFVASLMLHLWIIRNAETIFEALSYCYYKSKRNRLLNRIAWLESDKLKRGLRYFSQETQKLIQKIELFQQENPDAEVDFTKTMPNDLIGAIHQVMGKPLLDKPAKSAA